MRRQRFLGIAMLFAALAGIQNCSPSPPQTRSEQPLAPSTPAIFPQLGHSRDISALAFSPDGKLVATGSADKTVALWDVASGRQFRTFSGHSDVVRCVEFSPNGRLVVSGSVDKTVRVWDVANGREIQILHAADVVEYIAISPDGRLVAASSDDGAIRVWNVATGDEVNTFHVGPTPAELSAAPPSSPIQQIDAVPISFGPGGATLATGGRRGQVNLWNVSTGGKLRTLTGNIGDVRNLEYLSQGDLLVIGDLGPVIANASVGPESALGIGLWRAGGALTIRYFQGAMPEERPSVARDGKLIAIVSGACAYAMSADGRMSAILHCAPAGADALTAVALTPNGSVVALGERDGSVELWDVPNGRALATLHGNVSPISASAYSSRVRLFASGDESGAVKLWNTSTGALMRLQVDGRVTAIQFSPSGSKLAAATESGVAILDVATGQRLRTLNDSSYSDVALALAFSPDEKLLAAGSPSANFESWDVATGKPVHSATLPSSRPETPAVGFATSGKLETSSVWDATLAYSPDGRMLAQGGGDGLIDNTIRLTATTNGRALRTWRSEHGRVASLQFDPAGRLLASGNSDGTISLWEIETGKEIRTFRGHMGDVEYVSFSEDGKQMASAGDDGTERLWNVATGKQLVSFVSFTDGSSITVTPEGFFDSSSEQAEENLNVRIGERVFGISSFRENFYRPDLVKRALAGEDVSIFGSIDRVKLSPEVEFASLPASTRDPEITMTLNLTNSGGGFGPVRVFWNGTVIQQDNTLPPTGDTLRRRYTVPLLNGENEVRATAFNADGSMWSEATSRVAANLPVARLAGAHGTLHALVVGVQDFPRAPQHDLKYPGADAVLIARTLAAKASPLFDKLDVRLMTTAPLTDKVHVVKTLQAIEASAGPGDEFVFYVASHGIVGEDGRYYIATSNVNPARPSDLKAQAISAKELGALIANIRATRKLVILDTCDAGAASSALSESQAARRTATIIGRGYGFTVLAAANSNQDALEGGLNGHGLFTYVVNDGLSGKAADATGVVSSFLLADYVNDNVSAFAQTVLHKSQQPVAQKSGQAFAITKVR